MDHIEELIRSKEQRLIELNSEISFLNEELKGLKNEKGKKLNIITNKINTEYNYIGKHIIYTQYEDKIETVDIEDNPVEKINTEFYLIDKVINFKSSGYNIVLIGEGIIKVEIDNEYGNSSIQISDKHKSGEIILNIDSDKESDNIENTIHDSIKILKGINSEDYIKNYISNYLVDIRFKKLEHER